MQQQLAGRTRRVKETQLQTKAKVEIREPSGWWMCSSLAERALSWLEELRAFAMGPDLALPW